MFVTELLLSYRTGINKPQMELRSSSRPRPPLQSYFTAGCLWMGSTLLKAREAVPCSSS